MGRTELAECLPCTHLVTQPCSVRLCRVSNSAREALNAHKGWPCVLLCRNNAAMSSCGRAARKLSPFALVAYIVFQPSLNCQCQSMTANRHMARVASRAMRLLTRRVEMQRCVSTSSTPRMTDYAAEASQRLQADQASVQPEESLYYESQVRAALGKFTGNFDTRSILKSALDNCLGGNVSLALDEATGHATVTLEHENSRNAMTGSMMLQLADHITTLEQWHGRIVTVRGAAGTFCSGGHLPFVRDICTPAEGAKMSIFMQVQ